RVRSNLRGHRPHLDPDVCARCVRPHCARDHLLESRIQSGPPDLQVGGSLRTTRLAPLAAAPAAYAPYERLREERSSRMKTPYLMRSEEHTSELQSRGHLVC